MKPSKSEISRVMAHLGSKKSEAKTLAARANAKKPRKKKVSAWEAVPKSLPAAYNKATAPAFDLDSLNGIRIKKPRKRAAK